MANPHHLEILKQGVEVWNKWREENRNIVADLEGANLEGTYLIGTILKDDNLNNAKFDETIIVEVDLSETVGLEKIKHIGRQKLAPAHFGALKEKSSKYFCAVAVEVLPQFFDGRALFDCSQSVPFTLRMAPGNECHQEALDASCARRGRRACAPAPHVVPKHKKGMVPGCVSPAPSDYGIVTPWMTTGPSV
jgi:Pentapeptide repeats (8 copies)